jgi:simple sugar transport system permease protein
MTETLVGIVALTLAAGTPLVIAALGELVVERAGVLNLGVEGMMLIGAVVGFIVTVHTHEPWLGVAAAIAAGAAMALVFAIVAVSLQANQVASGLALSLLGIGLSAFVGQPYVAAVVDPIKAVDWAPLASIPVLGPLLFSYNPLVYASVALAVGVHLFLEHSRAGLVLRAVGESPRSAHAIGYRVLAIRYAAVLFGGACAGLAGAYLSLAFTPLWSEGMTGGRGWIALALVVFATWRPYRVLLGAWLFGAVTLAQFQVQAAGIEIPPQLLSMLPYAATIVVLAFMSRDATAIRRHSPASLGKPFHPER